ncbi:MAG: UDP-2,3-diacylglucosamine diphosphatase LpxI [Myxococcaceae bacterium]
MSRPERIGLVAGNGRLPYLFAAAARERGLSVIAVAHRGESSEDLAREVDVFEWVRVGQVNRILEVFHRHGVDRAVMAGGIGRVRALKEARPDFGAVRIISRLRSFRDDALLRAIAEDFEKRGVRIVAPTDLLPEILAPEGVLAGAPPDAAVQHDIELGLEVATLLGKADVGQTVVVRNGHVLALEAVEGTDEAIRRGGRLGGPGAVVVKLAKPQQDTRFDLPAVGPNTLSVMQEVGARVLALEAGRTIMLDPAQFLRDAEHRGIRVIGIRYRLGNSPFAQR